ncbi:MULTISPECIES: phytoene/squalene synthase family protein [unclassified Methylobacterium]|jgi:phytoene synthase|uniref:phytoene/squalene synthase family protein n=1 Tax=unclassified Methylobacterium TaxID=2615210 RepID=UPI001353C1D4|nr:phytoene/squalene synthase family protein [Methylobacterium sp. 2A]MWV22824.1 phytoene/squalene synthase family protein [Methylobacterium sp. 2A]
MPALPPEFAAAADRTACRVAIRRGSKSFFAAGQLLPAEIREAAYGLYAFCRYSDDLVDEATSPAARHAAVARLDQRMTWAYAGEPADTPADRAFSEIVKGSAIPEALPRALIEGLAWDAEGRRYADLDALHAYAARVAGSVGAMMALIMGVRAPEALARACDLGAAMQLTNIARDVGEDARMGRLYLPLDWMRAGGLDPDAFLADPRPSPALTVIVARLLAEADRLYRRAEAGIAQLPPRCRPAIRAAGLIYREIGGRIAEAGHDTVTRRARVGGARKLALLARAVPARAQTADLAAPALPQALFLIEAVGRHPLAPLRQRPALRPWWDVVGRVVHVLDLIERMQEREAFSRSAPS